LVSAIPHTGTADRKIAQMAKLSMSNDAPLRLLYVVSLFPCLSETFIVREINALIDRGADVRILSLKQPSENIVQPQAATLLERAHHPANRWRTMAAAIRLLMAQPVMALWFTGMMLRHQWNQPIKMAKGMVAVARAIGRIDEIRTFDPHLLHAPWATYPATVAWFLSKILRRPFSFTSRAHDIFVEDQMMSQKLRNAALAVTITEYNVRYMARWMPDPSSIPVHVIHSALDVAKLPYVRDGREASKLLSVGRLVPMKGFDVLLESLSILHARGVVFSCTIIGEGKERTRLEELRAHLGLEVVVELPGAVRNEEVVRQMREATLMVLPCVRTPEGHSDGIPNVLMESMAVGLPVVSTRISGIPELVSHGVNGCLVPAGDADALADAIQALLSDPHRREMFAAAGRRKVEQDFDVRTEAGRLLGHFHEVCHG
jgi:glycosyltransferase involved in cell wall biosynthesis